MELKEALKFYPSFTQEDIALLADCSIYTVRLQIPKEQLSQKMTKQWADEIKLTCEEYTAEQLARRYRTSVAMIHKARHGVPHVEQCKRVVVDNTAMIAYIQTNSPYMTQIEMAAALGVSQSVISKYNPKRRRNGTVLRKSPGEWVQILEYAKKHSISKAAKYYAVSRPAISKRMKKDEER